MDGEPEQLFQKKRRNLPSIMEKIQKIEIQEEPEILPQEPEISSQEIIPLKKKKTRKTGKTGKTGLKKKKKVIKQPNNENVADNNQSAQDQSEMIQVDQKPEPENSEIIQNLLEENHQDEKIDNNQNLDERIDNNINQDEKIDNNQNQDEKVEDVLNQDENVQNDEIPEIEEPKIEEKEEQNDEENIENQLAPQKLDETVEVIDKKEKSEEQNAENPEEEAAENEEKQPEVEEILKEKEAFEKFQLTENDLDKSQNAESEKRLSLSIPNQQSPSNSLRNDLFLTIITIHSLELMKGNIRGGPTLLRPYVVVHLIKYDKKTKLVEYFQSNSFENPSEADYSITGLANNGKRYILPQMTTVCNLKLKNSATWNEKLIFDIPVSSLLNNNSTSKGNFETVLLFEIEDMRQNNRKHKIAWGYLKLNGQSSSSILGKTSLQLFNYQKKLSQIPFAITSSILDVAAAAKRTFTKLILKPVASSAVTIDSNENDPLKKAQTLKKLQNVYGVDLFQKVYWEFLNRKKSLTFPCNLSISLSEKKLKPIAKIKQLLATEKRPIVHIQTEKPRIDFKKLFFETFGFDIEEFDLQKNIEKEKLNQSMMAVTNENKDPNSIEKTEKQLKSPSAKNKLLKNEEALKAKQENLFKQLDSLFREIRRQNTEKKSKVPNKQLYSLSSGAFGALSLKFSNSGRFLAAAIKEKNENFSLKNEQTTKKNESIWIIKIFDLREMGRCILKLSGHLGNIYELRWSDDDSRLISSSSDCTARVWDTSFAKTDHINESISHEPKIEESKPKITYFPESSAQSPSNSYFLTSQKSNFLRVPSPIFFNNTFSSPMKDAQENFELEKEKERQKEKEKEIYSVVHRQINLKALKKKPILTLTHPCFVYSSCFHPESFKNLFQNNKEEENPLKPNSSISKEKGKSKKSVNENLTKFVVVTGGLDGIVRVWYGAQLIKELSGVHTSRINTISFDASGEKMISVDSAGTIVLWNSQIFHPFIEEASSSTQNFTIPFNRIKIIKSDDTTVSRVNYGRLDPSNPNMERLFLHSKDNEIVLIDLQKQVPIARYKGVKCCLNSQKCNVSPSGDLIVSGDSDSGNVFFWDTSNSKLISGTAGLSFGINHPIIDVDWNPKYHLMAICSFGSSDPIKILYFEKRSV